MKPFLPRRIVETMKLTVDLNALTGRLDNSLRQILFEEMGVETITREHWTRFGRHYYTRHDYEAIASDRYRIAAFKRAKYFQRISQ